MRTSTGSPRGAYHALADESALPFSTHEESTVSVQWRSIRNLDSFLSRIYQYWHQKGWLCIILKQLFHVLTLGFALCFTFFLLAMVDWDNYTVGFQKDNPFTNVVILFESVFGLYWIVSLFRLFKISRDAWEMRSFYHSELEIKESELSYLTWDEVCAALIEYQNRRNALSRVKKLDHLDIAHRILRTENYILLLFQSHVFSKLNSRLELTKLLEWNFRHLVSGIYNTETFEVERNFSSLLRKRAIWLALLNFFAAPFMIIFLFVHLIFRYTEELRSAPWNIGMRSWSPYARWLFREYNELPHVLQQRLVQAAPPTSKYLSYFPMPIPNLLARTVLFVVGSFSAVIIIVSVIHDELFLGLEIGSKPLAWYLAVFASVLAVARSLISEQNALIHPHHTLSEVAAQTHYFPPEWNGKAHMPEVRDFIISLYPYRMQLFIRELFAVWSVPFVLFFWVPKHADAIAFLLHENTTNVEGVGHVCARADFQHVQAQDKTGASFMSFVAHHPSWKHLESRPEASQMFTQVTGVQSDSLRNSLLVLPASHMHETTAAHRLPVRFATGTNLRGRADSLGESSLFVGNPSSPALLRIAGAAGRARPAPSPGTVDPADSVLIDMPVSDQGVRPTMLASSHLYTSAGQPATGQQISRELYDLLQSYVNNHPTTAQRRASLDESP
eukprot:ANDGO_06419.mRNA.1 Autophagy-related protein 9